MHMKKLFSHNRNDIFLVIFLLLSTMMFVPDVSALKNDHHADPSVMLPVGSLSKITLNIFFEWILPTIVLNAIIIMVFALWNRRKRRNRYKKRYQKNYGKRYRTNYRTPHRRKNYRMNYKKPYTKTNYAKKKRTSTPHWPVRQNATRWIDGSDTNQFYECPMCHDPNIKTNQQNFAICAQCGFRYDFKNKIRTR